MSFLSKKGRGCKLTFFILLFLLSLQISPAYASEADAPEGAKELVGKGEKAFDEKRYFEALDAFMEATEVAPDNPDAWFGLGKTYFDLFMFSEALDALNRAEEIKPDIPDLYLMRAKTYMDLNRPTRAMKDLDSAIRLDSKDARAYFLRSTLYMDSGKYQGALDDLEVARKLDAGMLAKCHFQRAAIFDRQGKKEEAGKELDMAEKADEEKKVSAFIMKARERLAAGAPVRVMRIKAPRRWFISVDLGGEWSDNVITKADDTAVPDYIDGIHDVLGALRVSSDYIFLETEGWYLAGGYDYYISKHNEAAEYDLQQHSGSLTLSYSWYPWEIGVSGDMGYSWLQHRDYTCYKKVSPWVKFEETAWTDTTFTFSYTKRNYFTEYKGMEPKEQYKNGRAVSFDLTQNFVIDAIDTDLAVGFLWSDEWARGNDNKYVKYRWHVGADFPVYKTPLRCSVYVSFDRNDFKKLQSATFFRERRRDLEFYLDATVYWQINEHVRIYGGYVHDRFDSNIIIYDYTERLGKIGVVYDF